MIKTAHLLYKHFVIWYRIDKVLKRGISAHTHIRTRIGATM